MNKTTNFEFNLPEGTDNVDIEVLNANMDKLDEIFADIYSKLTPTPQPVTEITFNINTGVAKPMEGEEDLYEIYGNFNVPFAFVEGDTWQISLSGYDFTDTIYVEDGILCWSNSYVHTTIHNGLNYDLTADPITYAPADTACWFMNNMHIDDPSEIPSTEITFSKVTE